MVQGRCRYPLFELAELERVSNHQRAQARLEGPRTKERFRIDELLGRGSFGAVYRAYDRALGGTVALKHLVRLTQSARMQFRDEFRLLAAVHHRNLVVMHELLELDGEWLLTMELVRGDSVLAHPAGNAGDVTTITCDEASPERVCAPGRRSGAELAPIMLELADGIHALHVAGRLHRDIKPSNVLVEHATGRVVVLDFGLAMPVGDAAHRHTGAGGTPLYMAPEVIAGGPSSPRADWYSFGVVLYEALTGCRPFTGSTRHVLATKLSCAAPPPQLLVADIAPELDDLCVRLLQREPGARPDHEQIVRALVRVQGSVARPRCLVADAQPPFVGRARELDALSAALGRASEGVRSTVLVTGESGVGKTRLCTRFLETIDSDHALVLHARCYARTNVPHHAIDELISYLRDQLSADEPYALSAAEAHALSRILPGTLARLGVPDLASDDPLGDAAASVVMHAVAGFGRLVRSAARGRAVVMWIDDAQWLDDDAAHLLGRWMSEAAPVRALLVCCSRTDQLARAVAEPWPRVTLRIAPLDGNDSLELASSLAAASVDPSALEAVVRESHGNPFLLCEMARCGGAPASLHQALASRLSELDPALGRFLDVLAIAAGPLPQRTALDAAAVPEFTRAGIALLAGTRLIRRADDTDRVDLYHDRIRDALLDRLSAPARAELHDGLARAWMRDAAADPATIATHLVAAGRDREALDHLRRAAEHARCALAFARAAVLYGRASELAPADASDELSVRRAECLYHFGDALGAAEQWLAVAAGRPGRDGHVLRRRAGQALLYAGHVERGQAVLRQVLVEHGVRWPDTRCSAVLAIALGRARMALRHRRAESRSTAPRSASPDHVADAALVIDASSIEDSSFEDSSFEDSSFESVLAACAGLTALDPLRAAALQGQLVGLAQRCSDPVHRMSALITELPLESVRGTWGRGRIARLADELRRMAAQIDNPEVQLRAEVAIAQSLVYRSEIAQAGRALDRAFEALDRAGFGGSWEAVINTNLRLFVRFYLGDLRALRELVTTVASDCLVRRNRFGLAHSAIRHSVFAWLAMDDPAQAERRLSVGMQGFRGERYALVHHLEAIARAHLALYSGDCQLAYRIVRRDLPRAMRSGVLLSQFVRIDAIAALGRAAAAAAHRRTAVVACALLRTERSPWANALARLTTAALVEPPAAAARFRDAAGDCAAIGLALHARAARWQAARLAGSSRQSQAIERDARGDGIVRPERIFQAIAPYPERGPSP